MPHLNRARAAKILSNELAVRCAPEATHLDGAAYSLIDFDTMDRSLTRAFMEPQESAVTSFDNHFHNTCAVLKELCGGYILFIKGGMASKQSDEYSPQGVQLIGDKKTLRKINNCTGMTIIASSQVSAFNDPAALRDWLLSQIDALP